MACSDAASRPLGADAVEVYPRDPTVNSGWRRYELAFRAKTRYANPFEVEFGATFQHAGSGESLTLPGYYAGDDTWKVSFMPTRNGRWDWTTSSPETRLNSRRGSIEHAAKGRMARLGADPRHPRKWRLGEDPVIPVAIRCDFFSEPASGETFVQEADFVARNGILLMETRLTEEYGQFGNRYDFVFEGSWRDHRFDLEIWDRMQRRMDILAARGCGAHIMLYSDDRGAPGWSGRSETERLVIRYVIARLAAYPVVLFNTGIDIAEYRSQIDIDWMNEEFRQLDP